MLYKKLTPCIFCFIIQSKRKNPNSPKLAFCKCIFWFCCFEINLLLRPGFLHKFEGGFKCISQQKTIWLKAPAAQCFVFFDSVLFLVWYFTIHSQRQNPHPFPYLYGGPSAYDVILILRQVICTLIKEVVVCLIQ